MSRTRKTARYRVALMKTLLQMSIEFVRVELPRITRVYISE
jgi:hypothetical protein